MVFVTVLFVSTTTGAGETIPQRVGETLVVDCKVKPAAFVGQVKTTLGPERTIISWGRGTLTAGNVMLKTVP